MVSPRLLVSRVRGTGAGHREPLLRVERVGLDLELSNRVRRRREPDAARIREIRRAINRELVAALHAVGDDAAQVAVVHRPREVQVRRVDDAGRQPRQHVGRAVTERQLLNLLRGDRRAADAARRGEHRT